METEGSLPHSQQPATFPCPDSDRFIPYHPPHSQTSILISSSHLRLCLSSDLLPSGFPTKTLHAPLLFRIRATSPAHLYSWLSPNNITSSFTETN
jgi:hypothetical protein